MNVHNSQGWVGQKPEAQHSTGILHVGGKDLSSELSQAAILDVIAGGLRGRGIFLNGSR